jgi:amidase
MDRGRKAGVRALAHDASPMLSQFLKRGWGGCLISICECSADFVAALTLLATNRRDCRIVNWSMLMRSLLRSRLALAGLALALAGPVAVQPAVAAQFTLEGSTVLDIQKAINQGILTSTKLVQMYLDRIAAYEISPGLNLNAIISLNPMALTQAAALDLERLTSGARSALHGIPILLKDNIDTSFLPTTAGFLGLKDSIPPDNATITQKLIDAGAIILGKSSLTEFANYLTSGMPAGFSSLNGYTFNPYNPVPVTSPPNNDGRPLLSPGGSSAGSGAAMAANFATLTIGTETSGSILSPANQNSLVGIKPTVGLLSRDGIIPIAASQDTAGPMTRTVTDAAVLLGALTGVDPKDP